MKTLTAAILLIAVIASHAFATAQFPDRIIYEGKEYSLQTNPMEPYFEKHPDRKPKGGVISSALWRGYVAAFEFRTNRLFLKDIRIQIWNEKEDGTSWKSVRDEIVPKGEELFIDWFTGILVLPGGELVNYVHMGYGSTYSNYILLELKDGGLTGQRSFDHKQYEEFREKQFQAYRKTEEYKQRVEDLKKRRWNQESIDSFLRSYIVEYTSRFLDMEEKEGDATGNKK